MIGALGIGRTALCGLALALGAPRGVAMLAPVGGTLMILGWLGVGWVASRG